MFANGIPLLFSILCLTRRQKSAVKNYVHLTETLKFSDNINTIYSSSSELYSGFSISDECKLTQNKRHSILLAMTLTISFFLIVMMMLASISASSAENGPLTERLHALNPVLKDHRIVYSDPLSPSSYASQAIFNPRGMHHVYTITHTFLDLILRKEVLPKSLNATVIVKTIENNPGDLPKVLGNHWEELLLQYIGVITASICGLLLALAIPFAGM